MMTAATAIQIIDRDTVTADYGMSATRVVIEHPKHGRLYMSQGFGGMDTLSGGAVRWRHGMVCQLQPSDTLASLAAGEWNDTTNLLMAMTHGCDDSRPILPWDGHAIEHVADCASL